jgi:hypothetical protein
MIYLSNLEQAWLAQQRVRSCKHGHNRYDARVYRNRSVRSGSTVCNAYVTAAMLITGG